MSPHTPINPVELKVRGKLGTRIIKVFWPEFLPTEFGGKEDRMGIDGYIGKDSVQSKVVRRWIDNPEVFHQVTYIGDDGQVHHRPMNALHTILITWNKKEGYCAKIRTDALVNLVKNLGLQQVPMGGPYGNGWGYWIMTEWLTPHLSEKRTFLVSEIEEILGERLQ